MVETGLLKGKPLPVLFFLLWKKKKDLPRRKMLSRKITLIKEKKNCLEWKNFKTLVCLFYYWLVSWGFSDFPFPTPSPVKPEEIHIMQIHTRERTNSSLWYQANTKGRGASRATQPALRTTGLQETWRSSTPSPRSDLRVGTCSPSFPGLGGLELLPQSWVGILSLRSPEKAMRYFLFAAWCLGKRQGAAS